MKVWILTEEYNDYDQHGEYFLGVFRNKPTKEELESCISLRLSDDLFEHIIAGGGRRTWGIWDEQWYYLKEVNTGN